MEHFEKILQHFFATTDRIQQMLSERWREHTNRRTIVIILAVGTIATIGYLQFVRPPEQFPLDKLVTIPEGTSLLDTAALLQKQSVVRSPLMLRIVVYALGHQRNVQAGDYSFKEPKTVFEVAKIISYGAYGLEQYHIRVPEGSTVKQMAVIYGAVLERFDKEHFIAEAEPLEGFLFPDTYYFQQNVNEDTVLQTMKAKFDDKMKTVVSGTTTLAELVDRSGHSVFEIVTMASILEREAPPGADRKVISGILWRRLKIGMALQVDVTFLYTLGKGTFQLTTKDLKTDNPYNTYTNKGLPPGPIGSPSLDSLIAAVTPTKSNYLYFLADHSGITHYCKDYACQVANKDTYF